MRHNIQTIAEILIDKLDEIKGLSKKMEALTERPVKVDTAELQEQISSHQKEMDAFLSDLRALKMQNKSRLPGYVVFLVVFSFSVSIGLILIFGYKILSMEGLI